MSAVRRLALASSLALVLLAVTAASSAALDVYPSCSPAPTDCSGWHRADTTISWRLDSGMSPAPDSCKTMRVTTDGTATSTCSARIIATGAQVTREEPVRVDKTAPTVLPPTPARSADANGWYRAPVDVTFRGTDETSGIRSCTKARYSGLDTLAASVAGACTDKAGNSSSGAFPLRFDATPPVIDRAVARRGPDHAGWYNHPVVIRFRAKDAVSGLAQCRPVLVTGPPSSPARAFSGACVDVAGNVATRAFDIAYDDVPPSRPVLRATTADRLVRLSIRASPDTKAIRITRAPGLRGHRKSRVYQGPVRGFTDGRVANGRRYRYRVTAFDQAGNWRRAKLRAVPGAHLVAPRNGALTSAPPLLRWTRVRHARYYNVQLFREGKKVLSRWPTKPALQLRERWRFAGRVRHLVPGRYRWYVWPGLGRPAARQFGGLIGARSFTVRAGS